MPETCRQDPKQAPAPRIWYLHIRVWRTNPSGLFADWNPDVACRGV